VKYLKINKAFHASMLTCYYVKRAIDSRN